MRNVNTHQFATAHAYAINMPYFLPTGGSAQCTADNKTGTIADVYYGGSASPYTDSYVTDPTYVASGMDPAHRSPRPR